MDSKTKILTLDHADTIRNFVKYNDSIIKKDLTKYIDDNINNEATARQNADNALDNRTKTLESSVDTLNVKVDTLEESYDNLTGEIGDINTQLKDELLIEINNKITTAKGEVSEEYNTKVNTLTEELNALIAESVEGIEGNQGKIKEIQLALSTLEGDTNNA